MANIDHHFSRKAVIMDEIAMQRALMRIAHEIAEHNRGLTDVCLVGIHRRGVPLAHTLQQNLLKAEPGSSPVPLGAIDIAFHRDDRARRGEPPVIFGTDIPFDINGKTIILVDDVLYTGRTIRSAIDALFELGRPHEVQLAVLVDRGHRQLPFRADYVGKNIPTSLQEHISVTVTQIDGVDEVVLYERNEPAQTK